MKKKQLVKAEKPTESAVKPLCGTNSGNCSGGSALASTGTESDILF